MRANKNVQSDSSSLIATPGFGYRHCNVKHLILPASTEALGNAIDASAGFLSPLSSSEQESLSSYSRSSDSLPGRITPSASPIRSNGMSSHVSPLREQYWRTVLEPSTSHANPEANGSKPGCSTRQEMKRTSIFAATNDNPSQHKTPLRAPMYSQQNNSVGITSGSFQTQRTTSLLEHMTSRNGETLPQDSHPRMSSVSMPLRHSHGTLPQVRPSGLKRFQCQLCGSTFAQRGDLVRHIRVKEMGERNFHCDICSKSFGRRSILNKHLDRVHGLRQGGVSDHRRQIRYAVLPQIPRSSDAAKALVSMSNQ